MRWVTRRAIIGAALGLGLVATLGFAACGGPRSAPPIPTPPPPRPLAQHDAAAPEPAPTDAAADPAEALAAAIAAAKSCTAPTSKITNQPDGGVVFVNAWHRRDAGNIDRLQGIVGALAGHSDVFRCCFDVWAAEHPGHEGKLLLVMELEADGSVKSATVDSGRTDIDQAVTQACVVDVAKGLSYPESPSNDATLVEYPFVVQSGPNQEGAP